MRRIENPFIFIPFFQLFIMGKCIGDPQNFTKICNTRNEITLSFTKKWGRQVKKIKKNMDKNPALAPSDKEHLTHLLNSYNFKDVAMRISQSDVKSVMCVSGKDSDSLVILHPKAAVKSGKFIRPILPITVKSGKCEKFVKKSFLKNNYVPKEVFLNNLKNEIV